MFKTFVLLFYVVLAPCLFKQMLLYPTPILSGVIAIVQLFFIAIYFYDDFYHGSQWY